MITFNSITLEGFGSIIKPYTYRLDRIGLNKIEGPNGAGKTTIMSGISYAGWGKLVKPKSGIQPWPHIIDKTFKGTRVVLKFTEGRDIYEIIRCNDYLPKILGKAGKNRLIVLKNGKELTGDKLRDKADYQKWIISKIGYSFELFKSTVIFAQELDNLMQEDGPSKKKIFDEAFETTFVNRAKEKAETTLSDQLEDLAHFNNKLGINRTRLSGISALIEAKEKNALYWEEERSKRLKAIKEKISQERNNIQEVRKQLKNSDSIKTRQKLFDSKELKLKQLTDWEFKTDMTMNSIKSTIEGFEGEIKILKEQWQNPPKKCTECGKDIDKADIIEFKKSITTKINDLHKKIKGKKGLLIVCQKEYGRNVRIIQKIQAWLKNNSNIKVEILKLTNSLNKIAVLKRVLKDLKSEKAKILKEEPPKDDLPNLINTKSNIKAELSKIKADILSLNKKINLNKWLIKEPLSNAGLKAFIFDSMVGKVNNYLNPYAQIIGFGIKVFIDMSRANKDISIAILQGGDEIPYADISKGQKQLVNIALAFSLNEAVNSVKPINILFLDELFESLNAENIEKVGNMIIKKAKNKSVHLITHQTSFSPSNCFITSVQLNEHKQSEFSSN